MSDESKSAQRPGSRARSLAVLTLLLAVSAATWFAYRTLYGQWQEQTDNAQVAGNRVAVMSQTAGTVVAIHVDDTQSVAAGQLLVELDDTDAQVAVQAAEAHLGETARQVERLFADREQARAAVGVARTQLAKASTDVKRRRGLTLKRAISAEELQHAEDAFSNRRAALIVTQSALRAAQALIGDTDPRHHAQVEAAATALLATYVELDRTRILAPANGQVAERSVQVGQQVKGGERLMSLVALDQLWVEANFKEDQLRHLRMGQPVRLTSDIYGDGVVFEGEVEGLGAGTGSVFSLLPPQNATGNWIKIVQRLPVRVRLAPRTYENHPLRLGLSMRAEINTMNRSGPTLAQVSTAGARYATDIYARQRTVAQERVTAKLNEQFSTEAD